MGCRTFNCVDGAACANGVGGSLRFRGASEQHSLTMDVTGDAVAFLTWEKQHEGVQLDLNQDGDTRATLIVSLYIPSSDTAGESSAG